jgi:uncharacterized paraquat-inducible protein A
MTIGPLVDQSTSDPAATELDAEPRCVVCEHQLHDHDRISLRFCEATQTQALSRKCVCPTTT